MPTTVPTRSPLEALHRRAGANLAQQCGAVVVLDYGSPAGEVAACRLGVGIADRSELVKLEIEAPAEVVAQVADHLSGAPPVPGLALAIGHAWGYVIGERRLLVLCDPCHDRPVIDRVRDEALACAAACRDVTAAHAAIMVLGPHAGELLGSPPLELEVELPPAGAAEHVVLAGVPATLLHEAADRFLIVTDGAHAVAAWHALHEAGDGLGVAGVGREALDRLEVSGRTLARQQR